MLTELLDHLARHHGLVTTADALSLGLTERQLAGLAARRELVRVHRNVYRHAAAPVTLEQRTRAGLLAVGPLGVVSHRCALARRGVRGFECQLIEITHRSLALPQRAGLAVHRSRVLGPVDIEMLDGVPCTAPARTLIDCASVMSPVLVARYAQEWMANRLLGPDDLAAAMVRAGNHRGVSALGARLGDVVAGADSTGEALLGRLLRKAGLPPELHVVVATTQGHVFELDWSFPRVKVGLELDGYGIHLRSASAFDDDRWRRNELTNAGWAILNFTSRMCRRNPARVLAQVRAALDSASRRSGVVRT